MSDEHSADFRVTYRVVYEDDQTVTLDRDELSRVIADAYMMGSRLGGVAHAEWVVKQCRNIAGERPWSTEAETFAMVARFAARDAERSREKAFDLLAEQELRFTDLDELAERLTQN